MFGKASALAWLEKVFDRIGLDIEYDVSIWDVWPMISDEWLEKMAHDGRQVELQNAILQSYELGRSILGKIQATRHSCPAMHHKLGRNIEIPISEKRATFFGASSLFLNGEGHARSLRGYRVS
jgi:hypothetical protein